MTPSALQSAVEQALAEAVATVTPQPIGSYAASNPTDALNAETIPEFAAWAVKTLGGTRFKVTVGDLMTTVSRK